MDFHVEDNFPYSEISKLLTPSECKILRTEFDTKERDIFVKELEARVKVLWPNSSFTGCFVVFCDHKHVLA